jgi:hypothetical protein
MNNTPGAIRAGKNISERFRRILPNLPESNADTLTKIIDVETGAPELLSACKLVEEAWAGNGDMGSAVDAVLLAIANAERV